MRILQRRNHKAIIIIASNEIQEQGNKIKIKLQLLLFLPHRRDSFAAAVAHETGCAAVCTIVLYIDHAGRSFGQSRPDHRADNTSSEGALPAKRWYQDGDSCEKGRRVREIWEGREDGGAGVGRPQVFSCFSFLGLCREQVRPNLNSRPCHTFLNIYRKKHVFAECMGNKNKIRRRKKSEDRRWW